MSMDFTRLNNEYLSFWNSRDLNKAISNLRIIDGYLSQGRYDTWLNSYDNLFKPSYLVGLYNQITSTPFSQIETNISYTQLVDNFRDYVQSLITESQLIDEKSKRDLEELNNDWFSQIGKSLTALTASITNAATILPYLLIAGLGVYLFVNIMGSKK